MTRDASRSMSDGFVWHSQMTKTDHPSALNWRLITVSLL